MAMECANGSVSPFDLLTECNRGLFYDYPVGTKFKLKVKLTDREKGGLFFYTYFGWVPLDISSS